MAIKKTNPDVIPQAEQSVFEEVNAPVVEVKEEKEFVEPKAEPAIPLSTVQQWMQELETKFTNQLNKLKTSSARESLNEESNYISELEEDWLEQPVVFFAFSLNFSIHGDKRRGLESLPPHGAIKFKPLVRTRRKKGRDVQVVSVSSVKVQSQSELDYLRNHSQYGIAFYENMESAMNVDSTWAQKMVEAQQSISKLSDMQIIARAKQEGVTINQSPEAMRRQLVELTAKRSINQQDKMLYGNLRSSTMDQQGRIITEKKINS
jgi:hypothetical protein